MAINRTLACFFSTKAFTVLWFYRIPGLLIFTIQIFLIEQLEKMGTTEEAIRLRWGMILDYFGTVFYLVGDRPRAIECYELAKQVLPNDKKIAKNIVRAKS